MAKIIADFFLKFADVTKIRDDIGNYQNYAIWALGILGLLLCFGGFKIYRTILMLLVFTGITIASCVCLEGHVDWGGIVTCFAVTGVFLGFISFYWFRFGACLICGIIGAMIGWLICPSVWLVLIGGMIGVAFTLTFPVVSLSLFTAAGGVLLLKDVAVMLEMPRFAVGVLILGVLMGFSVQMLTNRKQDIFKKVRPDRVTYWMEKKGMI